MLRSNFSDSKMVLVFDSIDVLSSSSSSKNDELENHLNKVGYMSKEELLALPRIVEKDGTMNVINKPGWIWFNPFDFSNLLEMKWFSFIFLFAIIYVITFIMAPCFLASSSSSLPA